MAEYKVPQDVEAEDKLLGPFSFRQFAYLLIAVGAGAAAWGLSLIAIPLLVIPLPICIVFLILAWPFHAGQPMETYIAALIHFYFQPQKRLWKADGQDSLVEITNPVIDDTPKTKAIGGDAAASRLSELATLEDTQGWSSRGINPNLADDFQADASNAVDILDDHDNLNQAMGDRLARTDDRLRAEAVANMQANITAEPAPIAAPVTPTPAANYVQPSTGFAPPVYQPVGQPAAENPTATPTYSAAATVAPLDTTDEAALAAQLKQSSAAPTNTFRQTVIQPPDQATAPTPTADLANNPTLQIEDSTAPVTAMEASPSATTNPLISNDPTPETENSSEPSTTPTTSDNSTALDVDPAPATSASAFAGNAAQLSQTSGDTTAADLAEAIASDANPSTDTASASLSDSDLLADLTEIDDPPTDIDSSDDSESAKMESDNANTDKTAPQTDADGSVEISLH